MCRELGTSVASTGLLISNVIFKIFSVGIVSNLQLIKKVKVDETSRKKKKSTSLLKDFFYGEC